ncbi:MAG: entericidin [Candidatus Omnitrophica bacterium]|nr:entericidin [Candidatus Omnitrophota bacterium]
MKKFYFLILCAMVVLVSSGCATVKGMGEDISSFGGWMTNSSDKVNK